MLNTLTTDFDITQEVDVLVIGGGPAVNKENDSDNSSSCITNSCQVIVVIW
ncbi:hypothetical protein [Calothrix sp. UHCC 0171]|uniref:hypothetical protein n=1 Tax=Calothrix sp. UHCC 0171 TaxID=3110245 RepID=UPI002B20D4BA|nr:hypothetical protein [Calothrix sp. UHCC 0171]MEA5574555.1 hypothetical protein [Calothrix sp. UHCC 0171]